LSPDIWFVIAGFLPDVRWSLTGTHGFKYGKLRRAELKYPGNVKPRSMNKIFRKMFIQNSRGWHGDRIKGDEFRAFAGRFLMARIFFSLAISGRAA
jgi:hypothetical protein